MGMDVSANIFYGVLIEKGKEPWGNNSCFDEWINDNVDYVEIVYYGRTSEDPFSAFCVDGTNIETWYGSAKKIDISKLTVDNGKLALFLKFLDDNNIDKKTLGWHLVAGFSY